LSNRDLSKAVGKWDGLDRWLFDSANALSSSESPDFQEFFSTTLR
jgi:hypothetical protein